MHSRFRIISAAVLGLALVAGNVAAQTKEKKTAKKPAAAKVKKEMDSDVAAIGGTGVPIGYIGRTDHPGQKLSAAKYVRDAMGWDVTTGPAHILWRPGDKASGNYTVSATLDQLAKPMHPESYGIFIGGSDLGGPKQSYLYFLVKGTGELFVQSRDGDKLTPRIPWTKNAAVPVADANGKASYKLGIQVRGDSLRFWVNGKQVAALAKDGLATNGIYGLRINHNLHVHATPVSKSRP
jgi:hypothetical protein